MRSRAGRVDEWDEPTPTDYVARLSMRQMIAAPFNPVTACAASGLHDRVRRDPEEWARHITSIGNSLGLEFGNCACGTTLSRPQH